MRNRRGGAAGTPESGVTAGRGRERAVDVGAQEVAAKSSVRKNRLGGCGGGAGGRPQIAGEEEP